MRLAFRFRLIPFVATVLLVVLGILLGNWQTRRAHEKLDIAARMAERGRLPPFELGRGGPQADDRLLAAHPAALEYRRVRLTGEWVSAWPVFLDNRPYNGRAGFYLAMPFRIAGANTHVLVLRGWLPRDPRDYTRLPSFATPPGLTTIEGVATVSAGHLLQLGTAQALRPGAIVQNVETAEVAHASKLPMAAFFVQQTGTASTGTASSGTASTGTASSGAAGEGLVRDWPAAASGVDKHRGYAFQWYALAAMAALFFLITGFRSGRKQVA